MQGIGGWWIRLSVPARNQRQILWRWGHYAIVTLVTSCLNWTASTKVSKVHDISLHMLCFMLINLKENRRHLVHSNSNVFSRKKEIKIVLLFRIWRFSFLFSVNSKKVFTHFSDNQPSKYNNVFQFVIEVKDACIPNPCENNGKCIQTSDDGYHCVCENGYTGVNCESGEWHVNSMTIVLDPWVVCLERRLYCNNWGCLSGD